jgi:hypothetical protein
VNTVVSVQETKALPSRFTLNQNYPNPFNPSTAIGYELIANSFVTLKVFDMLGREVATLVNSERGVGAHSVTWDASGYPSGVYVYRLQARNLSGGQVMISTDSKRMVLIK